MRFRLRTLVIAFFGCLAAMYMGLVFLQYMNRPLGYDLWGMSEHSLLPSWNGRPPFFDANGDAVFVDTRLNVLAIFLIGATEEEQFQFRSSRLYGRRSIAFSHRDTKTVITSQRDTAWIIDNVGCQRVKLTSREADERNEAIRFNRISAADCAMKLLDDREPLD